MVLSEWTTSSHYKSSVSSLDECRHSAVARPCNDFVVLQRVRNCLCIIIIITVQPSDQADTLGL